MTGVCQSVQSIRLKRVVDVGTRREQLQRKVGVGIPIEVDETFAYGLRSPYRFNFDRQTGDLFLGDVGAARFEEVNIVTLVILCIPIVVLVVLGFVLGDWSRAGIFTIAIMLALAVFSLLLTGIKGLFT